MLKDYILTFNWSLMYFINKMFRCLYRTLRKHHAAPLTGNRGLACGSTGSALRVHYSQCKYLSCSFFYMINTDLSIFLSI